MAGQGLVVVARRHPSLIASAAIGRGCVPDDAHTFYCHERPTRHHLVKDWGQTIDVRLIVNDFDHDWQICRQLDQVRRVNDTVRANPCHAMHDSRTSKAFSAETLQERPRQRRVVPLVRFAEEDANEELIAVEYAHRSPLLQRPRFRGP